MFTGEFLFPGKDNNEMLKYIMQTKGKFSIKMLKKGVFTDKHFDSNYNFLERQVDTKTWTTTVKTSTVTVTPQR
jgi:serine/threonine-protein kinase PRP4